MSFGDVVSAPKSSSASGSNSPRPSKQGTAMSPVYSGHVAGLRLATKKVLKKDPVTRKKGVMELRDILRKSSDIADTLDFLPHFCYLYEQLWQDSTHSIRELIHHVLGAVLKNVLGSEANNQALTPYMHLLIGPWWLSCSDPHREAASTAKAAFNLAIPGPKRQQKVLLYLSPYLIKYIQRIFELSPELLLHAAATGGIGGVGVASAATKRAARCGQQGSTQPPLPPPAFESEDERVQKVHEANDKYDWMTQCAIGGLTELIDKLDEESMLSLIQGVTVPLALAGPELEAYTEVSIKEVFDVDLLWCKLSVSNFTTSILNVLLHIVDKVNSIAKVCSVSLDISECGFDLSVIFKDLNKEIREAVSIYSRSGANSNRLAKERCTHVMDALAKLASSSDIYWKEKYYEKIIFFLLERHSQLAFEYYLPLVAPLPVEQSDIQDFLVKAFQLMSDTMQDTKKAQLIKYLTTVEAMTYVFIKNYSILPIEKSKLFIEILRNAVLSLLIPTNYSLSTSDSVILNKLIPLLTKLHMKSTKDNQNVGLQELFTVEFWEFLRDRLSEYCLSEGQDQILLQNVKLILNVLSGTYNRCCNDCNDSVINVKSGVGCVLTQLCGKALAVINSVQGRTDSQASEVKQVWLHQTLQAAATHSVENDSSSLRLEIRAILTLSQLLPLFLKEKGSVTLVDVDRAFSAFSSPQVVDCLLSAGNFMKEGEEEFHLNALLEDSLSLMELLAQYGGAELHTGVSAVRAHCCTKSSLLATCIGLHGSLFYDELTQDISKESAKDIKNVIDSSFDMSSGVCLREYAHEFFISCVVNAAKCALEDDAEIKKKTNVISLGEYALNCILELSTTENGVAIYLSCFQILLRKFPAAALFKVELKQAPNLNDLLQFCVTAGKGKAVDSGAHESRDKALGTRWGSKIAHYIYQLAASSIQQVDKSKELNSENMQKPQFCSQVNVMDTWVDVIKLQRLIKPTVFSEIIEASLQDENLRLDICYKAPHPQFAAIIRKFYNMGESTASLKASIARSTQLFNPVLVDEPSDAQIKYQQEYTALVSDLLLNDETWLALLLSNVLGPEAVFETLAILTSVLETAKEEIVVQQARNLQELFINGMRSSERNAFANDLCTYCFDRLERNSNSSNTTIATMNVIFATLMLTPQSFFLTGQSLTPLVHQPKRYALKLDTPLDSDILVRTKGGKIGHHSMKLEVNQKCFYVKKVIEDEKVCGSRFYRLTCFEARIQKVHKEVAQGERPYYTLSIGNDREVQTEAAQIFLCEPSGANDGDYYGSIDEDLSDSFKSSLDNNNNNSNSSSGTDCAAPLITQWLYQKITSTNNQENSQVMDVISKVIINLGAAIDSGVLSTDVATNCKKVLGVYRHRVASIWGTKAGSFAPARLAACKILHALCESNAGRGSGLWLPFILRAISDSLTAKEIVRRDMEEKILNLEHMQEIGNILSILLTGIGGGRGRCHDLSFTDDLKRNAVIIHPWRALLEATENLLLGVALKDGSWLYANEHREKTYALQSSCLCCLRVYWAASAISYHESNKEDSGSAVEDKDDIGGRKSGRLSTWEAPALRMCLRHFTRNTNANANTISSSFFTDTVVALDSFVSYASAAFENGDDSPGTALVDSVSKDMSNNLLDIVLPSESSSKTGSINAQELSQIVAYKILDTWYSMGGDRVAFSLDSHTLKDADPADSADAEVLRSLKSDFENEQDAIKEERENEVRDMESDKGLFYAVVGDRLANAVEEIDEIYQADETCFNQPQRILGLFWLLILQKIDQLAFIQGDRGFIVRARCGSYLRQSLNLLNRVAARLLNSAQSSPEFGSSKKLSDLQLSPLSPCSLLPYTVAHSSGQATGYSMLCLGDISLAVESPENSASNANAYATKTAVDAAARISMLSLYRMTVVLPTATRAWTTNELSRTAKASFSRFVEFAVRPDLVDRELKQIRIAQKKGIWDEEEFIVRGFKANSSEVTACFIRDEAKVEIKIKIPPQYPLCNVEVDAVSRLGVSEARMRHVRFQIVQLLSMQDGTIVDGLQLWKNSLEKEFDGYEPCPICYCTLHAKTLSLPSMTCPTCSNKFHPPCLNQWFKQSGKYKCVICQQPFFSG